MLSRTNLTQLPRLALLTALLGGVATFVVLGGPQVLSFNQLVKHMNVLVAQSNSHPWLATGAFVGAYLALGFFGLPGNPVSVMVTFYQFVRDALLKLSGRDPLPALPTFKVACASVLKKAPGRTEFQRGVLTQDAAGAWSVRVTGDQGSGILRSMTEANCFIILPTDQGNVAAGALVDVQLMEGSV